MNEGVKASPNKGMQRRPRSVALIGTGEAVRGLADAWVLDICDSKRGDHSMAYKTLAQTLTCLAVVGRRTSLAQAHTKLAMT